MVLQLLGMRACQEKGMLHVCGLVAMTCCLLHAVLLCNASAYALGMRTIIAICVTAVGVGS